MQEWMMIATVIFLGAVQFWLAVPTGLAFGLHPAVVFGATISGGVASILIVVLPGEKIIRWFSKRNKGKTSRSFARVKSVMENYGIIGLGLAAPPFPGSPMGTLIGLALGAPRLKVVAWMCAGIVVWAGALTLIAVAGIRALGW